MACGNVEITDITNCSVRVWLGNMLGYSERSASKPVETIEFADLPKPELHLVTIFSLVFSILFICVIIVLSLRKLDTHLSRGKDEVDSSQSPGNPDASVLADSKATNQATMSLRKLSIQSEESDISLTMDSILMKKSTKKLDILKSKYNTPNVESSKNPAPPVSSNI